jgi:proteasome assembly chaperone (PAC2) family protein
VPDLVVERIPDLHDPVAVVAFEGWNDAASAATDAARHLVSRFSGRRFASIDAENFYSFTDSRPSVTIMPGGARRVAWQRNEFFYLRNPAGPHDIVVSIGVEPNLRWNSFAQAHIELYRQARVGLVVSLGALLADVPHTRPTRVTGSAFDPQVAERLSLTTSRYEGPTGIVGVLHDALRREGVPAASLWANTPHYISTSKNPIATRALLVRLQTLVGVEVDLRELEAAGKRFVREVDEAVGGNTDIADYVRRLEAAYDEGGDEDGEEVELPEPGDAVTDVEEFLRRQREG